MSEVLTLVALYIEVLTLVALYMLDMYETGIFLAKRVILVCHCFFIISFLIVALKVLLVSISHFLVLLPYT
jgi:hypothetical protein